MPEEKDQGEGCGCMSLQMLAMMFEIPYLNVVAVILFVPIALVMLCAKVADLWAKRSWK